jgi:hypothetical protein
MKKIVLRMAAPPPIFSPKTQKHKNTGRHQNVKKKQQLAHRVAEPTHHRRTRRSLIFRFPFLPDVRCLPFTVVSRGVSGRLPSLFLFRPVKFARGERKVDMPPHDTQRLCTIPEEYGHSTQSDVCCAVSISFSLPYRIAREGDFQGLGAKIRQSGGKSLSSPYRDEWCK